MWQIFFLIWIVCNFRPDIISTYFLFYFFFQFLPILRQLCTACHFIKISQVKKHDCHWIPGWLGMLRNEELLIRKNLVGPFWRNLTCSNFTMEQNSWKWGKIFSFFAFWGIMMQFYKFLHIIWIFPQNNWIFLYFMLLSMKFVPKPSKSIGKCRILVPEIQFWLFEGLWYNFEKHL